MEIVKWLIIIFSIIYIVYRFMPAKGVHHIFPDDLQSKIKRKSKIQFIDVRTKAEYNTFHRKPFINIPLKKLRRRADELDKEKEVVVICQSGIRSMQAAKILKRIGFEHIVNVKGGIGAWK